MIDWNNDGRVDPAEVVLTEIILGEQDDDPEFMEEETETAGEPKRSWFDRLFGRRRDT